MECPICLNDWNSESCIPLMMNCGHSYCCECLILLLPKHCHDEAASIFKQDLKGNPIVFESLDNSNKLVQIEIQCPNCQVLIKLVKSKSIKVQQENVQNEEQVKQLKYQWLQRTWLQSLIKNFALIQLVEAQKNLNDIEKLEKEKQKVKNKKKDKKKERSKEKEDKHKKDKNKKKQKKDKKNELDSESESNKYSQMSGNESESQISSRQKPLDQTMSIKAKNKKSKKQKQKDCSSDSEDLRSDISVDQGDDEFEFEHNSDQKIKKANKKKEQESRVLVYPPSVSPDLKCSFHEGQLIHSYINARVKKSQISKFKHTLLCTQCIYENELTAEKFEIIPQVISDIKNKVQQLKSLIYYRKFQLQQSQQYFQRIQKGNRQIIENKMKEHFQKLRNIMDTYEQNCEKQLSELLEKQEENMLRIQNEIGNQHDSLFNQEINLTSLEDHDDREIVYMTNIIDDSEKNLTSEFKTNIQIKDISITLQLKESVYSKMDTILNTTSRLMLDELRQDGEPIKFIDIIERNKSWKCRTCEDIYSKEIIFCEKCQIFRPMEMFQNLMHHPSKVQDYEINFLKNRRDMEKQLILQKDLQENEEESEKNIDQNKQLKKYWFIISSDWLFQWKCFISNKISSSNQFTQETKDKVRQSTNKEIGILPPGPIFNEDLFRIKRKTPIQESNQIQMNQTEVNELKIRKNLELNKDYRGVNMEVWTQLHKIYGGGPLIVREELDIYSKDVNNEYLQQINQVNIDIKEDDYFIDNNKDKQQFFQSFEFANLKSFNFVKDIVVNQSVLFAKSGSSSNIQRLSKNNANQKKENTSLRKNISMTRVIQPLFGERNSQQSSISHNSLSNQKRNTSIQPKLSGFQSQKNQQIHQKVLETFSQFNK